MRDDAPAIRPATAADIPALLELWREFMLFHAERDPYYTLIPGADERFTEWVGECLASAGSRIVVAETSDGLVGYGNGKIVDNPPVLRIARLGYVMDLAVTTSCRRRGVGEALFAALCDWFRDEGLDHVELTVAEANPVSQDFWKKMGFEAHTRRLKKSI